MGWFKFKYCVRYNAILILAKVNPFIISAIKQRHKCSIHHFIHGDIFKIMLKLEFQVFIWKICVPGANISIWIDKKGIINITILCKIILQAIWFLVKNKIILTYLLYILSSLFQLLLDIPVIEIF